MPRIDLDKVRKVLIVKLSAIGDVVHALPAVNFLKEKAPWIELSWIVEDKAAPILEDHPALDNLIILPRRDWQHGFKTNKLITVKELISFFRCLRSSNFDLAVDLQGLFKSGLVTYFSGATYRVGYSDAREGSTIFYNRKISPPAAGTPVVERYLQLIKKSLAIGNPEIEPHSVDFALVSTETEEEKINNLFNNYKIDKEKKIVVINPLTSWESKNWPLESYSLLCDKLIGEGNCQVLLTGSRTDFDKIELIIKKMQQQAFNLAGKVSLKELAELYKRAGIFIGGDTGPMHIAAAVNCPVVAIMGPTDPDRNGPYGVKNIVVRKRELNCLNCWKRECPLGHNDCMNSLQVKSVFQAVRNILEVNYDDEL